MPGPLNSMSTIPRGRKRAVIEKQHGSEGLRSPSRRVSYFDLSFGMSEGVTPRQIAVAPVDAFTDPLTSVQDHHDRGSPFRAGMQDSDTFLHSQHGPVF